MEMKKTAPEIKLVTAKKDVSIEKEAAFSRKNIQKQVLYNKKHVDNSGFEKSPIQAVKMRKWLQSM